MDAAPSMVQRSGDTLIVRSVVSGNQLYLNQEADQFERQPSPPSPPPPRQPHSLAETPSAQNQQLRNSLISQPPNLLPNPFVHRPPPPVPQLLPHLSHTGLHHNNSIGPSINASHRAPPSPAINYHHNQPHSAASAAGAGGGSGSDEIDHHPSTASSAAASAAAPASGNLPQCKIKRNYSCNSCTYFTQNPRHFLTHLKDVHGEKIVINACRHCLYASRHYQKLVRHMKMVHGSTDGLEEQALSRKRASQLAREQKKRKSGDAATPSHLEQQHHQQQQQHQHQQQQQHIQQQMQQHQHHQHSMQLQIQRQYQAQMEQQHQQLMQQQHIQQQMQLTNACFQRPLSLPLSPSPLSPPPLCESPGDDPSAMLVIDTSGAHDEQSIDSCPSSPEPPEPIVSLLDGDSPDESSPPPSSSSAALRMSLLTGGGGGGSCGDQSDNSKQLKCTLCEFSTYWRSQLVEHERHEHKLTQFYRCAKCTYVTHIKARYSKHVKYHSMPMIKCEMCDFRTPYKWNLDRHMKNHGGAGLYKCSACNFTADIKQSLTVHEMNHHVPPVGHASGMSMARRRNKVGGTDILNDPEYGGVSMSLASGGGGSIGGGGEIRVRSFDGEMQLQQQNNNHASSHNNNLSMMTTSSMSSSMMRADYDADTAAEMASLHDMSLLKKIKLEAPADLSMKRTSANKPSGPSRPVPQLIPILGAEMASPPPPPPLQSPSQASVAAAAASAAAAAMNMSIQNRNLFVSLAAAMSQTDLSGGGALADLPPNATLQDFAALLFSNQSAVAAAAAAAAPYQLQQHPQQPEAIINLAQLSPNSSTGSSPVRATAAATGQPQQQQQQQQLHGRRKGSGNFFEEMQQKLAANAGNVSTLVCPCGHAAKCLSERIIHQKQCAFRPPTPQQAAAAATAAGTSTPVNLSVANVGGSIRCQYCRHRCKSSTDLFVHMQNCLEARTSTSNGESLESGSQYGGSSVGGPNEKHGDEDGAGTLVGGDTEHEHDEEEDDDDHHDEGDDERDERADRHSDAEEEDTEDEVAAMRGKKRSRSKAAGSGALSAAHPMENRVFVWNKQQQQQQQSGTSPKLSGVHQHHHLQQQHHHHHHDHTRSDSSELDGTHSSPGAHFYGIETAPGYGEVTQKIPHASPRTAAAAGANHSGSALDDDSASASLKKVFKCPHCSFWASTASRFHVHIVGHLNKKPFECSLCSYRSNWRWDITKHIRLKTIRDPGHKSARVLMNDETGRRNYTKYNKHITLMKVTEEDGDPKLLKSGEMTPSQEAALSFLGQSSSDSMSQQQQQQQQHNSSGFAAMAQQQPISATAHSEDTFAAGDHQAHSDAPLSLVKPTAPAATAAMPAMPALIPTNNGAPTTTAVNNNNNNNDTNPEKKSSADGGGSGDSKKAFKCKKCHFRHPNRDVVLTHVKGHYHDAGIQLAEPKRPAAQSTPIKTAELLPPPPPPPPALQIEAPIIPPTALERLSLPASVSIHLQPVPAAQQQLHAADMSMPAGAPVVAVAAAAAAAWPQSMFASSASDALSLLTDPSVSGATHSNVVGIIEHGEMDEASSQTMGGSGTSSTTVAGVGDGGGGGNWRDPAPYRCGHCHQVSNWKHVIQRHCRLKHNGDINIEFIEKGNRSGQYARLFIPGLAGAGTPPSQLNIAAAADEANDHIDDPSAAPHIDEHMSPNPTVVAAAAAAEVPLSTHATTTTTQQNQLIQLLNKKPQHHMCAHCVYSTPCRSQLDAHQKTFHPQQQQPAAVDVLHPQSQRNQSSSDDPQPMVIDLDDSDEFEAEENAGDGQQPADAVSSPPTSATARQQLAHIQRLRAANEYATNHASIAEFRTLDDMPPADAAAVAAATTTVDRSAPDAASEKCPHCPFATGQPDRLKEHMQHHRCVAPPPAENGDGGASAATARLLHCDHCDFSAPDERVVRRHVRLHFSGGGGGDRGAVSISNGHNDAEQGGRHHRRRRSDRVRYYTRYEGLVLSARTRLSAAQRLQRQRSRLNRRTTDDRLVDDGDDDEDDDGDGEEQIIYPLNGGGGGEGDGNRVGDSAAAAAACRGRKSVESAASNASSDKENKIIVDIVTGEVLAT